MYNYLTITILKFACRYARIVTVNLICLHQGFVIVPQQSALIIERFGKFLQVLESGLDIFVETFSFCAFVKILKILRIIKIFFAGFHFLVPFVDQCTYIHSLKEMPIMIEHQAAVL